MVSTDNNEGKTEIDKPNGGMTIGKVPLHISTSHRGLLYNETTINIFQGRFFKFGSAAANLPSPTAKFRRIAEERDEISRSVPSSPSHGFRVPLSGVLFAQKIDWKSLGKLCKEWIRNPFNMALLVWITCVSVSGFILFLLMTGMLNSVIPRKSERNVWYEINNQILNALSTLMCLYTHPKLFYHLVLLCRWKPDDISRLRKMYCKNGTYKPKEWTHIMVVVILLHLNCFAQYALCGLNLGYKRSKRPAMGVGICVAFGIGATAMAGAYYIVSPLGKEYDCQIDEEAQVNGNDGTNQLRLKTLERKFSFASGDEQKIVENQPKWQGGVLDFWDDISLAYLSLFCSFCVFGWNMERLGFGNMYVHIATFLLFCLAPFWIFNLAAVNIENEVVREALGVTGIILCVFGLLYGGFWRIQMRRRFNLPPNNFCCGKPAITDCAQWFFCCWCTLAQEVRTGNFYDIVEDKFCKKQMVDISQLEVLPSPGIVGAGDYSIGRSGSSSPSRLSFSPKIVTPNILSPSRFAKEYNSPRGKLPMVDEETSTSGKEETMTPPTPSLIQREAN